MRKAAGFTLVELVITLAVGAIALTIAIPSYTNLTKSNRLTTHANLFVAAMNLARIEAIKRQVDVDVTQIGGNWASGWTVTATDGSFTRQFPAKGHSVTFKSTNTAATYRYRPTGRINGAGDTLTLCDDRTGERGRLVTVSATGRLGVTEFDCD